MMIMFDDAGKDDDVVDDVFVTMMIDDEPY